MNHSHSPRAKKRGAPITAGIIAGALAASAAVFSTSNAAFSATTQDENNTWTAGTVALTDDDNASKMFNVGGLVPGQVVTRCIQVTYTGTASSVTPIKMYSALNSETLNLSNYLNVKVEEGTGGAFGSCSGFSPTGTLINGSTLKTITTNNTNFATGVGTFTPTSSPATVAYRFTVTLDAATPNSSQGGTADASFTWAIQTN